MLIIWKSHLSDKIKRDFFQAAAVSTLLYGCTTWTLTKCIEKKLDENCMRLLWVILNKSLKKHRTKQQLYSHLPPISEIIQIRRTRHAVFCWRSRNKLISNVLLWTPSHERACVGRLTRTYLQKLGTNTVVKKLRECHCGVMVKATDCGIVVSEFELQLRYYVHFGTNTLGKCLKPLILLLRVK